MRWNPIDHMNAARANKPASGGKTYRYPKRKRETADTNAAWMQRQIAAWYQDKQQILNDFQAACLNGPNNDVHTLGEF